MELYSRLYVGESVNNADKIIRKLKKGSRLVRASILTLADNEDQLEIYDARILTQKYFRFRDFYIIGIAGNYDEAVELVVKITGECFALRGDCDLKSYLKEAAQ